MGIISRFFKKPAENSSRDIEIDLEKDNNSQPEEVKAYVKGGNIAYHPELINELKHEHRDLVEIFTNLVKTSETKDKQKIRNLLDSFKKNLVSHILKENVQFYVYVKYLLADDPVNGDLAKIMQQEMNDIGKTVLNFIAKSMEDSAVFDSEFQAELNQIGSVLTERIKIEEEKLYVLYMHPDSFK
jgi:regulator of sigma D